MCCDTPPLNGTVGPMITQFVTGLFSQGCVAMVVFYGHQRPRWDRPNWDGLNIERLSRLRPGRYRGSINSTHDLSPSSTSEERPEDRPTISARALALSSEVQKLSERVARTRLFRAIQVLIVALFVAFVVQSLLQLFRSEIAPNWFAVITVSMVGGLLLQMVNAAEFHQLAKFSGAHISSRLSFMTTLHSTLVNQLPIPGSIAVRVAVMKRNGASIRAMGLGTTVVAGLYLSVNLIVIGTALLMTGTILLGVVSALVGLGGFNLSVLLGARRKLERFFRWVVNVAVIEVILVVVSAGRLYLVLWALGYSAGLMTAVVLTVASAVAVAVGVLPVGLGVREGLMAVLAPLVSLSAVATTTAAIFERTFRLAVVALLLLVAQIVGFRRTDLEEGSGNDS